MLTPQEVAEHGFSKAHVGGYNMKEVDDFLDQVTEDYGELHKENAVLKGKMKLLAEKISEYRQTEEAMRSTLLSAQRMAQALVAEAEEEKKKMIAEAETLALQRKAELEREIAEAEGKLAAAQDATRRYVEQVRELVRQESEFLDRLPVMKVTAEPAAPKEEPIESEEETERTGDSIDQILQEEREPQSVEELERELAAASADGEVESIDFGSLKFGKDYEIE